ncbi:TetR/AcrR family transcriptional regulator [Dickeya dianthicola]|nr:TetR/AcrR family transcriptional regulator [Dickeya dianthicola]MZI87939.1 TetR/AcrR family transcriptional regulator [Dickeya dianthicola]QOL16636.1 TetR/AcrR family transcriptional regulator [Dickeya dianthicola]
MLPDTRQALIQSAEFMIRSRGYSAFSYADLEKMVGIRKASIHHHFPKKEDLGMIIVESNIIKSENDLQKIESQFSSAYVRLCAFASIFRVAMQDGMLPLCGALAAEMTSLPSTMQNLTRQYFHLQLVWLEKIINEGISDGEIPDSGETCQKSFQILSLLEGSSFIRWALNNAPELDNNSIKRIIGIP